MGRMRERTKKQQRAVKSLFVASGWYQRNRLRDGWRERGGEGRRRRERERESVQDGRLVNYFWKLNVHMYNAHFSSFSKASESCPDLFCSAHTQQNGSINTTP